MNREARRVTIVSGASGALGRALVESFLRDGHSVVAVDRPSREAELAERIGEHGLSLGFDATSNEGWDRALEQVGARYGAPTGAVLAAGGWAGGKPFHATSSEDYRRMLDANLETARAGLQAIVRVMIGSGRGSIVVIGSKIVERPWESRGAAAYAASKAALVALMRVVAAEALGDGVRVNAVLPSTIDTENNRRAMPSADPDKWVRPQSLGRVIAFLLSEDSRDVSGAAIPVYGRS